jgi:hypothetical protein
MIERRARSASIQQPFGIGHGSTCPPASIANSTPPQAAETMEAVQAPISGRLILLTGR